jgi:hypothetical protein
MKKHIKKKGELQKIRKAKQYPLEKILHPKEFFNK